ncbi:MAG: hypothetical protein AB8I08_26805 [Sandaracinaceae bacterium]
MPFFRYDAAELRDAAARFVADLPRLDRAAAWTADVSVWEELLLDWWTAEAAPRVRVEAPLARIALTEPVRSQIDWPGPREAARGGPVTLMHRSPVAGEGHPYSYAYWRDAVASERLEVLLAAQVELGCGGRPASRFGRVMLAASDLAPVAARAKALFFSTMDEGERRRLFEQLGALRLASWDTRPWLVVDVAHLADREAHPAHWDLLDA